MADTLGGSHSAVKPHLQEEAHHRRLQRLLHNAGGQNAYVSSPNAWRQRAGRGLLSNFLKSRNQLGNINANHRAFTQPALNIELEICSVKDP